MANEYDCDMYNMCNQMYNQMYLTTWHYVLYMLKMPFNSSVANLIFASRELFFEIILKNLLSVLRVTVKFKQSLKKAIFSSYNY